MRLLMLLSQVRATDVKRLLKEMHAARGERVTEATTELHTHPNDLPRTQCSQSRTQY